MALHTWSPLDVFTQAANTQHRALVMLNRPIDAAGAKLLEKLWEHTSLRVCVDGAANQLHAWKPDLVPDIICGDMDSCEEQVKVKLTSGGARVQVMPDQDKTDLTKALEFILEQETPAMEAIAIQEIYVFGDHSGRLDHALANLHALYALPNAVRTFMVSAESVTFLLRPGLNVIYVGEKTRQEEEYCGLFALGRQAVVSTQGLRYNMQKRTLAFGTFVSSSNSLACEGHQTWATPSGLLYDREPRHCSVEADQPVLWTMSI